MMATVKQLSLWKRSVFSAIAFVAAGAIWLPSVSLFFRPAVTTYQQATGISPLARQLAARHLELWENPDKRAREMARMRTSNAEWDFMGRTYLVLALTNMALREPADQARYLAVADQI